MDYLVPEQQSYHLDMGSVSGAGEVDAAGHFRELYGGRGQASLRPSLLSVCHFILLVHLMHKGLVAHRVVLTLPFVVFSLEGLGIAGRGVAPLDLSRVALGRAIPPSRELFRQIKTRADSKDGWEHWSRESRSLRNQIYVAIAALLVVV